jgi:2,4-dienoyl-CoA reductase-like NADH-dependent reductase (Old Yellow Enzyme family)
MTHFILMLTKDDRTVPDALEVYDDVRDADVSYVGFKDIGLPIDEMKRLAARIHADGRQALLEVVSTNREAELRSVRAALDIGVDYLLGGRHVRDVLPLLASTSTRYFPFCGHTSGHPTRLTGTIEETITDARRLASMGGVHGLDLLSYRFNGDAEELTRQVVDAVDVPVLAAGSIDRPDRVRAMCEAGVWGFTVGTALFDGKFAGGFFRDRVQTVMESKGPRL